MGSAILGGISAFFLGILNSIISGLQALIDLFQSMFLQLVGLGTIYDQSGNAITGENGDIIINLFNSDVAKNIMTSMLMLGIILIVIFSAMAVFRSVYKEEKETPLVKIIGNSMRALLGFLLVPGVCMLGIWFSNILLQAVDGATSAGNAPTFSGRIFIASAYEANIFRGHLYRDDVSYETVTKLANNLIENAGKNLGLGATKISSQDQLTKFADLIDYNVANNFPNAERGINGAVVTKVFTLSNKEITNVLGTSSFAMSGYKTGDSKTFRADKSVYLDQNKMALFYNIGSINYLVELIATGFMLYIIGVIVFGLASRVMKLAFYYIVSPLALAMYPLDEGKVFGLWKGEFIKNIMAAYGAVIGMNIFIQILPLFMEINLFPFSAFNSIVQLIFMLAGGLFVKSFIGQVSGWVGGVDALAEGSSTYKSVAGAPKQMLDASKKPLKKAVGLGGKFVGGAVGVGKNLSNFGSTFKNDWDTAHAAGKNRGSAAVGGALSRGVKDMGGAAMFKDVIDGYSKGESATLNAREDSYANVRNSRAKFTEALSDPSAAGAMLGPITGKMKTIEANITNEMKTNQGIIDKYTAAETKAEDLQTNTKAKMQGMTRKDSNKIKAVDYLNSGNVTDLKGINPRTQTKLIEEYKSYKSELDSLNTQTSSMQGDYSRGSARNVALRLELAEVTDLAGKGATSDVVTGMLDKLKKVAAVSDPADLKPAELNKIIDKIMGELKYNSKEVEASIRALLEKNIKAGKPKNDKK